MIRLRLKEYLEEKKVTRYVVAQRTGIKFQTIDNYYKNKVVRYDSYILDAICRVLDCDITDILVYEKDGQ